MSSSAHHPSKHSKNSRFFIEIVPYDEEWPYLFTQEAEKIARIFNGGCLDIHHIGSTSVPGLAAKPAIDIIVVVKDFSHVEKCSTEMEAQGYKSRGICSLTQAYVFIKDVSYPSCNFHIFEEKNSEIAFHLKFRDYLRTHDAERDLYAAFKTSLSKKYSTDPYSYCMGKAKFFKYAYEKMEMEEMANVSNSREK